MGAGPIVCTPLGDELSLLYGLQEEGEAYCYLPRIHAGLGVKITAINQVKLCHELGCSAHAIAVHF